MRLEDAMRAVQVAQDRRREVQAILDRTRLAYLQACTTEAEAIAELHRTVGS